MGCTAKLVVFLASNIAYMEKLWIALGVVTTAMIKFAFAPPAAYAAHLPMWSSVLLTILGMMTTVSLIVFGGTPVRRWIVERSRRRQMRRFTRRNRLVVRLWQRFGIWGIALLTPVLFSPILGSILAVSLGVPMRRIFFSMFVSACLWAVVMSALVYYVGDSWWAFFR